MAGALLRRAVERGQRGVVHDAVETDDERDLVPAGLGDELVAVFGGPAQPHGAVPGDVDVVNRLAERPVEAGAESLGTHVGPVLPGAVPVGGIAEFDVRRKRETERKPRGAVAHLRRLDPHGHGVQLGMPHGGHPHGNPLDRIFARGDAAPEVEPLHGIAQLLQPHPLPAGLRQQQSHSAEIDTLGVTHHPVAQRLLLGIRNVVTHHAPLRLPDGAPELLGGLPLG